MLSVVFINKGGVITMAVNGHAGQDEIGKDIVCAACSILAYTVAQIVKNEEKKESFKSDPVVKLNKGAATISCEPKKEKYGEILHAFSVAQVGYDLLARNYPQYVDFTPFGEPEKA